MDQDQVMLNAMFLAVLIKRVGRDVEISVQELEDLLAAGSGALSVTPTTDGFLLRVVGGEELASLPPEGALLQ